MIYPQNFEQKLWCCLCSGMVYMPFCNMLISNELQKAVFCVIKDGLLACGLRPFATRKAVNCVMPVCGRLGGKTQLAVAMLCNDEQNE